MIETAETTGETTGENEMIGDEETTDEVTDETMTEIDGGAMTDPVGEEVEEMIETEMTEDTIEDKRVFTMNPDEDHVFKVLATHEMIAIEEMNNQGITCRNQMKVSGVGTPSTINDLENE